MRQHEYPVNNAKSPYFVALGVGVLGVAALSLRGV